MYVEDQITAMRQLALKNPYGWLICYENRPLQGIPPKGSGPHLLFFLEEPKARAFMAGRKKFYGEEPLSAVNIDSPDTLKSLALNPSNDPRYAPPACGIVLDFDYASASSRKVLSPAEVNSLLPVEIARTFGFTAEPPAVTQQASRPAPERAKKTPAGEKRPLKAVWISCGVLLVIVLILLCIGGIWYGIKSGVIPALPFLPAPAATSAPTATSLPTATAAPTATSTPAATPAAWEIQVEDDFSSNIHGWPLGLDDGQYGTSNIAIQDGKLTFELTSIDNCWYWWYPDLPSVSDFDASVEVRRVSGSTTGDYGMAVRANGASNSFYYFAINDTNQEYAFFMYKNEKWTTIHDWTFNAAIQSGSTNKIEVRAKGSNFIFLINGVVVGLAEDASFSEGRIGILSELYDSNDSMTVEYDNLVLFGNR